MNAEFYKKRAYTYSIVDKYRKRVSNEKGAKPEETWVTNVEIDTYEGVLSLRWAKSDKQGKIVMREARGESDPDPPLPLRAFVTYVEKKGVDVRISAKAYNRKGERLPDEVAVFVKPKENPKNL